MTSGRRSTTPTQVKPRGHEIDTDAAPVSVRPLTACGLAVARLSLRMVAVDTRVGSRPRFRRLEMNEEARILRG